MPAVYASRFAERLGGTDRAQVHERHQREDEPGDHSDAERERQHGPVQSNFGRAGNRIRVGGEERLESAVHQGHAGKRGDEREHQAFGQQLPEQPQAGRTESRPDRVLAHPAVGPRDEEVGQVRAGDEQHERHGALQDDERLPDAADDVFLQRVHAQPVRLRSGVVGRVRPGRDRLGPFRQHPIDFGERLRMRHAVLPPSDQIEEMAAARRRERRGVDRERLPELDLLIVDVVAARHDPDDLVRLVVDLNRLPDHVLAPAVRALPQLPREDRDRRRVRHGVSRREPASAQRRRTQRRHQLRRHGARTGRVGCDVPRLAALTW